MTTLEDLKAVIQEEVCLTEKTIDEKLKQGFSNFNVDLAGYTLFFEPTKYEVLMRLADYYVGKGGWSKVEVIPSKYSGTMYEFRFTRTGFTVNDLIPPKFQQKED